MRLPGADSAGLLGLHRFLLGDTNRRLSIYQQAIASRVKPGATVLDLGSGTGVLAFLACRAGARRVYAIEMEASRELGKLLARANGFEDRIVFLDGRSDEVELPERVDVIVSDTYGTFGLKKHGLHAAIDARRRFLKAGGTMIPHAIELFLAPIDSIETYSRHVDFWNRSVDGVDFSAVREIATNTRHPVRLTQEMLLAEPVCIVRLDLMHAEAAGFQGQASIKMRRAGTLHGFGGWFRADLTENLTVSSDPSASTTNYAQTFFPVERPSAVEQGDTLKLSLASYDNLYWRWQGELHGRTFDRSNFVGFLPETRPSDK